jgi:hypothetical protein
MNEVEIVAAVLTALNAEGIPYMLVGSLSSNAYGIPRSTKDAGFVVQLGNASLSKLASKLPPGFRLEAQIGFETITSTTRYRMHYEPLPFMIEFFEVSDDPHDQLRFKSRVENQHAGVKSFLPRAEDVIIQKIRWSRGGKRQKDLADARDVLAVQQGKLDMEYIRSWCSQHRTLDILEGVLKQVPKPAS